MKYELSDFLTTRTQILQNSVLNNLLIAYLSSSKGPVFVGKTLIKLEGKLKDLVKESNEDKNKKLPNFVMVDVFAIINDVPAKIGYIYKDFPPVYFAYPITGIKEASKKSIIYYLKFISVLVCNSYFLNASSADKIFSKPPSSFLALLNYNKISINFWKTGFHKRIKTQSFEDVKESELEEYYETLNKRLSFWRNFNLLLIELIKKGRFKISHSEYGEVKAEIFFRSLHDISVALEIIPKGQVNGEIHILDCEKLSPKTLNLKDEEKLHLLKIFGGI